MMFEIDEASVLGAEIVADDGQYLGKVTNAFQPDSIVNEFGPHGSKFSGTSIHNEFGVYGSQFSGLSPFNQFAVTPPKVVKGNKVLGFVTVNQFLQPRIDPDRLISLTKRKAR